MITVALFALIIAASVIPAFAETEIRMVPDRDAQQYCVDRDECFDPDTTTVDIGEQVTWVNRDLSHHTVVAGDLLVDPDTVGSDYLDGFDSGLVPAGESFSYTFEESGEYPYFCMIHPWMRGVIEVRGAMQDVSIDISTVSSEYEPGDAVIVEATITGADTAEVSFDVQSAGGTGIASQTITASDGYGSFEFALPDSAAGAYTITASVDDSDASDTARFTVAAPEAPRESSGGGCLIATATYGSELAPQVQFLRELRDSTVLSTSSGISFMAGFNSLYYSFSPAIADLERQSPAFKEVVKAAITPMLLSLNIMSLADEGSEISVLSLGISTIFLNLGMYIGLPAVIIARLCRRK